MASPGLGRAEGSRGPQKRREKGIRELPSGSLQVRVYTGVDPVTGKEHYLTEVVPDGPKKWDQAEIVRARFVTEINERRNPRTSATTLELIERYLVHFDGDPETVAKLRGYVRKHVAPFIPHLKAGELDAEILDSLYLEMRRCRDHCDGKGTGVDHRTLRTHECDHRCRPHECKPLGASTIRHIHYLFSGAYRKGIKWHWVYLNPADQAEPPAAPRPNPEPPSTENAARILNEAWRDLSWGILVWLVMVTGFRRAEPCSLRWSRIDLAGAAIALRPGDTKGRQPRRISLDPTTVALLAEYKALCQARARELGIEWDEDSYVFSNAPDHQVPLTPRSVGQRYKRMATRLGIATTIHKLRHYSATELILAGVDIRTVAGRLGHADGGATTLKVYAAYVAEADQRAAAQLHSRVPDVPTVSPDPVERAKHDPRSPYEKIAAELRQQILNGEIVGTLPPMKTIASANAVALSTVHRAVSLLKAWDLVEVVSGNPTKIIWDAPPADRELIEPGEPAPSIAALVPETNGLVLLELKVRKLGDLVRTLTVEADPNNPSHLRQLLVAAVRRYGGDLGDYEMDVRRQGDPALLRTFVVMPELL